MWKEMSTVVLPRNRIVSAYKEGRAAFGIYMRTPSEKMVEMLGCAGLDFVRIDLNAGHFNTETVEGLIRTAHAVGVTPAVRVERNDAFLIQSALDMGALQVIVPEVGSVADVEAAVKATKLPPFGDRHAGPGGFVGGYGSVSGQEFRQWAAENVILSVQVEKCSAVEQIERIVSIPGLDMVQSGRGTLAADYGVSDQYHPIVMEAEAKVMQAGIAAGKMTAVQYYPLRDPRQVDWVRGWVRRGVKCLCLGTDIDIVEVFRRLLRDLKA
jgi:4-hydroxy-2-oxoheptanedioate aldolase